MYIYNIIQTPYTILICIYICSYYSIHLSSLSLSLFLSLSLSLPPSVNTWRVLYNIYIYHIYYCIHIYIYIHIYTYILLYTYNIHIHSDNMTQRSSSRCSPQGFWAAPLQSVASHGSASRRLWSPSWRPCGEEVNIFALWPLLYGEAFCFLESWYGILIVFSIIIWYQYQYLIWY